MSISTPERNRTSAPPGNLSKDSPATTPSSTTTPSSAPAPETAAELKAKQIRQAEELLFSGPHKEGFAKALYGGQFRSGGMFPYPELGPAQSALLREHLPLVRDFAATEIDPDAIDRAADIPASVVKGLGRLGVLGMTAPPLYGGLGFNQSAYCRIMEILGGRCASTAIFVNAHHSIGIRALLLFGTPEQQALWLPGMTRGDKIAAFALTEAEAGSDAANVQTKADPTPDGKAYVLNGGKRYITNGGIADVLTVMARTPDPKGGESKITAFLVTPDMPGFRVVEERREKCGIRGTATGELAFENMRVPAENILGPLGKGLRVALTVLDFGRTTFGACCTGAAKTCMEAAVRHANTRKQFGRTLGEIDLIRKKIALMAADIYAMEAATYETAALIDSGADDYMLETAILKVFTTERLWEISYETLQVHGGQGYFSNEPYERMMRDARINTIGEGANEVLKAFIALVGMRDIGKGFESTLAGLKRPSSFFTTLWKFSAEQLTQTVSVPKIPVQCDDLRGVANALSRRIWRFALMIKTTLARYQEALLERQLPQERIADAAIALFTVSCTLARWDHEQHRGALTELNRQAARLYVQRAFRTFDQCLQGMKHHDDALTLRVADLALQADRQRRDAAQ